MKKPEFMGGNEAATGYDRNDLARRHNEKLGERKNVTRRKVKKIQRFVL